MRDRLGAVFAVNAAMAKFLDGAMEAAAHAPTSKNLPLVLPLEMSLDSEEINLRLGCLGRVFTARVISSLVSVYLLTVALQGTAWVRDRRTPVTRLALGWLDVKAFVEHRSSSVRGV